MTTFDASDYYIPKPYSVTQTDMAFLPGIVNLELKGRDFPMDEETIIDVIKSNVYYSVVLLKDNAVHGWAVFHAVDEDLYVDRLSFANGDDVETALEELFKTITWTVLGSESKVPEVTLVWPEHSVDNFLFKGLLASGWKAIGLVKDRFPAYGSLWDGIEVWKKF